MRPASQQPKAESGQFFPIACPTFDFCVSVNRDKIRDQFSEHRALAGGPGRRPQVRLPFRNHADIDRLAEGLSKAGISA